MIDLRIAILKSLFAEASPTAAPKYHPFDEPTVTQFENVPDAPELDDPDEVDIPTKLVSQWEDERNSRPFPF